MNLRWRKSRYTLLWITTTTTRSSRISSLMWRLWIRRMRLLGKIHRLPWRLRLFLLLKRKMSRGSAHKVFWRSMLSRLDKLLKILCRSRRQPKDNMMKIRSMNRSMAHLTCPREMNQLDKLSFRMFASKGWTKPARWGMQTLSSLHNLKLILQGRALPSNRKSSRSQVTNL